MDRTHDQPGDHGNDRERLWDLIKDIKFAMFTTKHGNGHLHSRPMTTQNGKIDEDSAVGHLGPDLLGPDWDVAEAVRRLRSTPQRPVGEALADQRNLAGIGNMYKAEVCFLAGLSPWAPVFEVADLPGLVSLAQRVLEANKQRAAQTTTGDTRRGQQLWVYARAGQPCRRCRTPIRRAAPDDPTGERSTYWCPRCQPGRLP